MTQSEGWMVEESEMRGHLAEFNVPDEEIKRWACPCGTCDLVILYGIGTPDDFPAVMVTISPVPDDDWFLTGYLDARDRAADLADPTNCIDNGSTDDYWRSVMSAALEKGFLRIVEAELKRIQVS